MQGKNTNIKKITSPRGVPWDWVSLYKIICVCMLVECKKKKSKVSTLVRLSVAEEGDLFMYAGAGKKFSKRKTKKSSLGDFIFVQHVY